MDTGPVLFILATLVFAVGIIVGYNMARRKFLMYLQTAEQKIRLAEFEWERIKEHDREKEAQVRRTIAYEQRAERLRTMRAMDFVHLTLPDGVPKDYKG